MIMNPNEIKSKIESELLRNMIRGKLDFPKEDLCYLSLYFYSYYKCLNNKVVKNRLIKGMIMCDDTNFDSKKKLTEKSFARKVYEIIKLGVKESETLGI